MSKNIYISYTEASLIIAHKFFLNYFSSITRPNATQFTREFVMQLLHMDMFMDVFGELLLMGLLIMVMNTDPVVRLVETQLYNLSF